ncbi:MAG: hypothetical protein V4736_14165, partial [Bdellovibrionota bacterium]
FAKSLPMPLVIGNLKRLEMLRTMPELRTKLWRNALQLQKGLKEREVKKSFMDPEGQVSIVMYSHWRWALRYGIPSVVLLGYVLQIIGLLR